MSTYRSFTDVELALKLSNGDVNAFTEIHTRYYTLLYRHASQRLQDDSEVEDILQELFLYLWDNRDSLHFNVSLSAYLYAAVRKRILNVYTRNKIKYNYLESLQHFVHNITSETDQNIRLKQLQAIVEAELKKMPAQMRLIFEMSRKNHLSHLEIADELNISVLTVRKQVQRSLKILKIKLGTYFFLFFLKLLYSIVLF